MIDPELPALEVLTGADASDLLGAAIAPIGASCEAFRISQIRYVPSKSVTVEYVAEVAWSSGPRTTETLVAASGIVVPDGTAMVAANDVEIAVWRYPDDPFLPGLAAAADPARVAKLLTRLGAPAGEARLRRRAYRPGRRAVIEVVSPQARIYLKVLRPRRVADLQATHASMADRVPVPHSYGWSEELGLVALQAMPGKTLRKAVESGARRLPTGSQFVRLLDSLPDPPPVPTAVQGPVDRVGEHAHLLRTVAPDLTARIDAVVETVQTVSAEPAVSVHGDFHSSQVLVQGPDIAGLIDVDTTGVGERSNDLAGLIGHLSTLSLESPSRRIIERYGAKLMADFDSEADPADLRLRTAATVLGLATGPFRVQDARWREATERRVALAERWVASARQITR